MQAILSHRSEVLSSSVAAEVSLQLAESGRLCLRGVEVFEDHGSVVLSGRVPTFYLKQLAQSIASSVDGVDELRNELTVEC